MQFVCVCSPVPDLAWSRSDGKQMPIGRYQLSDPDNSELLITTVEKSDEGGYKCEAKNSAGSDHFIVQVDVQCTFSCCQYFLNNILFFYQRGSIASYASAATAMIGMSVRPSVRHTVVLYQNEQ